MTEPEGTAAVSEPAVEETAEPVTEPGTAPENAAAPETEPAAAPEPEDSIEEPEPGDLDEDAKLEAACEALLLVVDTPIHEETLAQTLGQSADRVLETLERLRDRYTAAESGIDLRRVGDGWRYYTRDVYAPYVERLLLEGQRAKLTRAALETLAVIAYRQPVTRARVAAVRGVNVDGVIRTLIARGLIEEVGTDGDTNATLYRTTELFLERIGLAGLEDLPPIAPLLPEVDSIDDLD
ncbi:SMC-Scp complex subunit ScpB [Sciscionella marina]|uniref:SMC-Scp complex subunit ScpB n=1 Tax=Sciscionella marina TaxID=508770 RepID=UPI0003AAFF1F|nr:SMC-Scp complex subunit ScpB [Sciscionella marina]